MKKGHILCSTFLDDIEKLSKKKPLVKDFSLMRYFIKAFKKLESQLKSLFGLFCYWPIIFAFFSNSGY